MQLRESEIVAIVAVFVKERSEILEKSKAEIENQLDFKIKEVRSGCGGVLRSVYTIVISSRNPFTKCHLFIGYPRKFRNETYNVSCIKIKRSGGAWYSENIP